MNRTLVWASAALTVLVSSAASGATSAGYGGVDAALHSAASKAKVVSLQFAAAHNGAVAHTFVTGRADVASGTAATDKTIYAIESCSKAVTAMAAMKLIDAGKFSLDTNVFNYLALGKPKSSEVAKITVVELMNHSAGLPDEIKDTDSSDVMSKAKAVLGLSKLLFTPGQNQKYSNVGFAVLGAMVEKASGKQYQQFVEDEVFKPAGITDAQYEDGSKAYPQQATRYSAAGKALKNSITPDGTAGGGWMMSASDGAKLLAAYDAGKIISKASHDKMLAPPVAPLTPRKDGSYFGLGWDVVEHQNGRVMFGKNGGGNGAHAWLEHDFAGNDFAVFSSGGNGTAAHAPGLKAVQAALDKAAT
jgi:D-alanyl-D-alanine carboxypeptidase